MADTLYTYDLILLLTLFNVISEAAVSDTSAQDNEVLPNYENSVEVLNYLLVQMDLTLQAISSRDNTIDSKLPSAVSRFYANTMRLIKKSIPRIPRRFAWKMRHMRRIKDGITSFERTFKRFLKLYEEKSCGDSFSDFKSAQWELKSIIKESHSLVKQAVLTFGIPRTRHQRSQIRQPADYAAVSKLDRKKKNKVPLKGLICLDLMNIYRYSASLYHDYLSDLKQLLTQESAVKERWLRGNEKTLQKSRRSKKATRKPKIS